MKSIKLLGISFLSVFVFSCSPSGIGISQPEIKSQGYERPKLVVGIVIDQMRHDYISKYWDDFSEGGFKRLVEQGFSCENHHYSYAPTYTGPGHASIYTGTTPVNHGIISNDWFDRSLDTTVYCTSDTSYITVGSLSTGGQMSPHRMISSTMCDEMKLFSNMRSKSIGISIKDRGAILPSGHLSDGAYWFEGGNTGGWISSSRYMESLPDWLVKHNADKKVDQYLEEGWHLMSDISVYDESGEDNVPYENPFSGDLRPALPYDLKSLAPDNGNYSILKSTPWGNTLTTDMAIASIEGEKLGTDVFTDFLAVSYSSPDYAGHKFGPQSLEIQDIYLRLDKEIERFMDYLDAEIGADNYILFLTADHGVVEIPALTEDLGYMTGKMKPGAIEDSVVNALKREFGDHKIVRDFINAQFFLDRNLIESLGLNQEDIEEIIIQKAMSFDGIHMAFSSEILLEAEFTQGVMGLMQKGYNQARSGDVLLVPKPGWLLSSYPQGTSHGSPFSYDTHVPLIFYGSGIESGRTYEKTLVEDIAPTVSAFLGIQMPNACTGSPIIKVLGE